jgi:hypothetical protein
MPTSVTIMSMLTPLSASFFRRSESLAFILTLILTHFDLTKPLFCFSESRLNPSALFRQRSDAPREPPFSNTPSDACRSPLPPSSLDCRTFGHDLISSSIPNLPRFVISYQYASLAF